METTDSSMNIVHIYMLTKNMHKLATKTSSLSHKFLFLLVAILNYTYSL